jgi:hypothetical protein
MMQVRQAAFFSHRLQQAYGSIDVGTTAFLNRCFNPSACLSSIFVNAA